MKWYKEKIKSIIFKTGGFFLRKKNKLPYDAKKILIISLLFRGDILFQTPVFRYIKTFYPDSKLDVWIKSRAYEILENNTDIDSLIVFDDIKLTEYEDNLKFNLKGKIKLLKSLRKNNYDIILDLTGIFDTAFFTLFARPKYSTGINAQGFGFCYDHFINYNTATIPGKLINKYLEIIRKAFPSDIKIEPKPILHIGEKIKKNIDKLFEQRGISSDKPLISLHVTAGWKEKRWDLVNFIQLTKELILKFDYNVIIVGDNKDKFEVEKIIASLKNRIEYNKLKNLFISSKFIETAEIIRRSDVFIGNDSAPLHLAGAVTTPSIGLFGPTNPAFSNPSGDQHVILYNKIHCSARPDKQYCTLDAGRRCKTIECMKLIKVNDVLESVNFLLSKYSKFINKSTEDKSVIKF
jgi:lipopolysaccharide heptosyltransferase II